MQTDSDEWLNLAVERRAEVARLEPYLLAGMRFAQGDHVARRGERVGHERQLYCEGGCGAVLVQSVPYFLCHECRNWGLEMERRIRVHLRLDDRW